MGGIGVHRLSNIDPIAKTALCAECGPIGVSYSAPRKRWRCRVAKRANTGRGSAFALSTKARMFAEQGGMCAICESEFLSTEMVLDHDHACCDKGKYCSACVRGLLCRLCNLGIGYFKDDPDALRAAAEYLDAWAQRKAPTPSAEEDAGA